MAQECNGLCEEINKTTKKRCTYKGKFTNKEGKLVCGIHNKKNSKTTTYTTRTKGSFELFELPNEIICAIIDFCDLHSQVKIAVLCCHTMTNMFPQFSCLQSKESVSQYIATKYTDIKQMKELTKSFKIKMLQDSSFAKIIAQYTNSHEVLTFFKKNRACKNAIIRNICKNNNTELMRKIIEDDPNNALNYLLGAIEYEALEVIEYILLHNPIPTQTLCTHAASCGALNSLKYLHNKGYEWNEKTCSAAVKGGSLECLKYAHENGCPWYTVGIYVEACQNGRVDCLEYIFNIVPSINSSCCVSTAINYGHLNCIVFLHENNLQSLNDCNITFMAVHYEQLDILKYLHEQGYEWKSDCCTKAVEKGNLQCLKYLHENGCPWNESTYHKAIQYNKSECVTYLEENGCPKSHYYNRKFQPREHLNKHLSITTSNPGIKIVNSCITRVYRL